EQATGQESSNVDHRFLSRRWSAAWDAIDVARLPVLILDSLDVAPVDQAALHWIAVPAVRGAVVIVRVNSERAEGFALSESLRRWPQTVVHKLEGLDDPSDRSEFIRRSLTVHLKTVDRATREALVRHPSARDPLFLATVLAELRLHGRHDDLAAEIERRFA